MSTYTIGLDYGTNSARAVLVAVADGAELAQAVYEYPSGEAGILLDARQPELARQRPDDYVEALTEIVREVLGAARRAEPSFRPAQVIGLGVDTTGSTPLPLDADGRPLADHPRFTGRPAAQAWLWKDHTAHAEAAEITAAAARRHPEYLAWCGGAYSSEWFWAKLLKARRADPEVFAAAATWIECADFLPAVLTGQTAPDQIKRCICAAGHKAMFNAAWGGYPDPEFLAALDPELARIRRTLPARALHIGQAYGALCPEWAQRLGLPTGLPVAVGAFDAHLGAVGAGIRPGVLVKIMGTSTCDLAVAPLARELPAIPGLCGVVPESILPGFYGLEAGQSAVGDIFNWYVQQLRPGGGQRHAELTAAAAALTPGASGLLALDWQNGNRTVLVDQRLTGLLLGLTLQSTPGEIYRALIEGTAFGARMIVERFTEYGVPIERVITSGGIAVKNPLVMQIYADVLNRPMEVARSTQTCALGAALAAAVVAGPARGGHADFNVASAAMTSVRPDIYRPRPAAQAVYARLFKLYQQLHDLFGTTAYAANQFDLMKDLLTIRDAARGGGDT